MNKDEITVLIEKGCSFDGLLAFDGTARIAGECNGQIKTPHVLIIEKSAVVHAEIIASEVIIYGKASGRIEAKEQIYIAEEASFIGDVVTPLLQIDEGAHFEGHSKKPQISTATDFS